MNQEQFEAVTKLSGEERYDHFLDKAEEFEEVWSLRNDEGFVSMADDNGKSCIPFWPHPEYAKALASDDWSDCVPVSVALDDFLNRWLPGMAKDDLAVSVFPTTALKGVVIDPARLKEDFELEPEQGE